MRRSGGLTLSRLFYDRRYRGVMIQVIVLIAVAVLGWWLVVNTLDNLAAVGKDVDFSFLWSRAGYEIGQTLIPYSQDDTHFRAAVAGLLNTLLVAVLGCVAATLVGVIAGILRLSRNWLIARLMTVYVEMFRNIPLLLWILAIFAIFTELTPPPNAYRGAEPTAHMLFNDSLALTNRYTAIPTLAMTRDPGALSSDALNISVNYAVLAFLAALFLGWRGRRAIRAWAERRQNQTGHRPLVAPWQMAVTVLPLLALWLWFEVHLEKPVLKGFNFTGGLNVSNAFVALWLALTLYTGAFIAEIVRSGILAVPKGQTEAATALGLGPWQVMRLVILPQALRVIVPPLISQYLNLTKNSSLAIAVGYLDLRGTLGGITPNQTGRELEGVLLMMLVYLGLSLLISAGMNVFNARVRLKER